MPSQYAVDHPTLPVNQRYFHLIVIHQDCQAATISRQIFGIRKSISGNVFSNPRASSSSPSPRGFNPWISNVTEDTPVLWDPLHVVERQIPDTVLNPRFQTGPAAENSFDPKEGRFSKNYGADQQRLQISEVHIDRFPTPTTFACWKIRFKTEMCTCSQFPTEAMLWINGVELVDSVDDLKIFAFSKELLVQTSSCSTRKLLQH